MNVPLTVLVPIKNEAHNLPRCLGSVAWADEIIVVDSGSTDGSQSVAESYGARVVQFQFNGRWPKKKNWALDNIEFRNEWLFIIDADECLPASAEAEFREIICDPAQTFTGWWINRRFMFMGKWLKHSYYPNWNLRLFRHVFGRYEKLTDSETHSGDNEVHEHVVVRGETARLNSEMDHYAFPSIETFVEKHNRYSNWEARVASEFRGRGADLRRASILQSGRVGWRRRLKLLSHRLPFRPTIRFLYIYIIQLGFLDGIEGYYFAKLHAFYEFLCVVKEKELRSIQLGPRKS